MGTRARIVLFAADEDHARAAATRAFDRIAQLDDVLSDYKKSSELMQLCAKAGSGPQPVSGDLFDALVACRRFHRMTGGAFDPTVGPIVKLWRTARGRHERPPDAALRRALQLVGMDAVVLDAERRTVSLTRPGMQLDMGGIGKGIAADAAAEVLRRAGWNRHLIDLGGDLTLGAPPPDSSSWRVRLEDDRPPLKLSHGAVATSGDTEQFVEIGGVRYSHIVDPRTGLGLTNRWRVTVIAPTGTEADALASALSVMGVHDGIALAERLAGIEAAFERSGSGGALERRMTSGFERFRARPDAMRRD